jgi:dolichyl-phosphate-mannose--protein O-mannosyl transferase
MGVLVIAGGGLGRGGPHIAIWIVVPIIVIITGVVIFQLITRLRPGDKRRDQ